MVPFQDGHQYVNSIVLDVDASNFEAMTDQLVAVLPYNAVVVGGALNVVTAFDSTTNSATVKVGADTVYSGVNLKAAAATAITGVNKAMTGSTNVTLTLAVTGAAPTVGRALVRIDYIVVDRSNEVHN